jgi:hypothetical protein
MSGCITTAWGRPYSEVVGGRATKKMIVETVQNEIVMREQNNNRTKWLHLRLTPDEYVQLHRKFKKTTCRKLSGYARKMVLGKPVVATYRNQSLDDFMAEMMVLRRELNSIGNNFNQAVKKLHTLHQIVEFRSWLITYDTERQILLGKVEEIKNNINKIADQWLQ